MRAKAVDVSNTKPDQGSLELTKDIVRARAYRFYEERGRQDGHDREDWFRAEAEIAGEKPVAEGKQKEGRMAAVAG